MFSYNYYISYFVKEFIFIFNYLLDFLSISNMLLDYLSYNEMEIRIEGKKVVFYLVDCIFNNKSFFLIRIEFIDINNIYMYLDENKKIKLYLVDDNGLNKENISNNIFSYSNYIIYESLHVLENCKYRNEKYNQIVIDSAEILNNKITAELINYNNNNNNYYEKIKFISLKLVF